MPVTNAVAAGYPGVLPKPKPAKTAKNESMVIGFAIVSRKVDRNAEPKVARAGLSTASGGLDPMVRAPR